MDTEHCHTPSLLDVEQDVCSQHKHALDTDKAMKYEDKASTLWEAFVPVALWPPKCKLGFGFTLSKPQKGNWQQELTTQQFEFAFY